MNKLRLSHIWFLNQEVKENRDLVKEKFKAGLQKLGTASKPDT